MDSKLNSSDILQLHKDVVYGDQGIDTKTKLHHNITTFAVISEIQRLIADPEIPLKLMGILIQRNQTLLNSIYPV